MKEKIAVIIMTMLLVVGAFAQRQSPRITVTLDGKVTTEDSPNFGKCRYSVWEGDPHTGNPLAVAYGRCPQGFNINSRATSPGTYNTGSLDPKSELGKALIKAGFSKKDLRNGVEVKAIKTAPLIEEGRQRKRNR